MATDLIPVEQRNSFDLLPQAFELAERIARTEFVPAALRGKPEAVMACVLTGHEMGISPMQALAKIHVIEGRPALSAELMRAIVLGAGHDLWVEDQTISKVTVCGKRSGSDHTTRVTWTMDDASKAGLNGKQNWRKYPRAMLLARATGELCRLVFPDLLAGLSYTVEEITDGFDPLGDEEPAPAETPTRARKAPGARKAPAKRQAAPKPPPATADGDLPPLPGEEDIVDAELVDDGPPPGDDGPLMAAVEEPRLLRTIAAKVTELWPCDDAPRGTKTKARDRIRYTLTHGVTKGRTVHLDELTWAEAQEIETLLGMVGNGRADVDVTGDEALVITQPSGFRKEVPWVDVDEVKAEGGPEPEVPPEPPAAPPAAAADGAPHTWDVDAWKAFIKDHGQKVVQTMREAQRLAGELGVAFESLDDLSGEDPQVVSLAALVQAWVLEQGGAS